MNLFKSFKLTWWQAAVWKVGMGVLGIVVGAYWHTLFGGYLGPMLGLAVVCLAYITYVWWKQ